MHALSEIATTILERMDPNRIYEPLELRELVPDTSPEGLRELMHELWVKRYVERCGYSGWRRDQSTCGVQAPPDSEGRMNPMAGRSGQDLAPSQTEPVRPEDLFDHDSFAAFFK
jgi:hypothetical protein